MFPRGGTSPKLGRQSARATAPAEAGEATPADSKGISSSMGGNCGASEASGAKSKCRKSRPYDEKGVCSIQTPGGKTYHNTLGLDLSTQRKASPLYRVGHAPWLPLHPGWRRLASLGMA